MMAITGFTTGAENVIVCAPVPVPPVRRMMSLSGGPLSIPGAVKMLGFTAQKLVPPAVCAAGLMSPLKLTPTAPAVPDALVALALVQSVHATGTAWTAETEPSAQTAASIA